MKKLFLSLLLLGMTFCSFARAFFAYDDTGIQFSYDSNESSFDHKFIDVAGMSILAGWEFNTDDVEKPLHYSTGLNIGFEIDSTFCFGLFGGINYKLVEFGPMLLELQGMVEAGWASQMLLDNGFINGLYNQNTLDLVLMLKNRRIFYIGAGISDYNLFDFAYKNSSNKNGFYTTTIGYHFIGGIRL